MQIPGGAGEHTQFKKRQSGRHSRADWQTLVDDIREHGVRDPIEILKSQYGSVNVWEGNHRIRAAIEANLPLVPVRFSYAGHSEEKGLIYNPKTGEFSAAGRVAVSPPPRTKRKS